MTFYIRGEINFILAIVNRFFYFSGAFGAGIIIDSWAPGCEYKFTTNILIVTKFNFNLILMKSTFICSGQTLFFA